MTDAETFNVVFVGGGNVMFGSDEGPWNHSLRFERKLGERLRVVAVIDPNIARTSATIQKKLDPSSGVAHAYASTKVYKSFAEFCEQGLEPPRVFVIGSPPMFRGSTQPGRNIEKEIIEKYHGSKNIAIFVEKPVTTGPQEDIEDAYRVSRLITESRVLCSVGYMLRYLKAVRFMKEILETNNLHVMNTIARYACAYQSIAKLDWWDKSKSAGPIIEQGTHFCDLSRYFGGDVDIPSVRAHTVEWNDTPGRLSRQTIDESLIPPERRIPRVTSAHWRYKSGAVGSLTHVVALQGKTYACEFEIFADGYYLKLVNPYVAPRLYLRTPLEDEEQVFDFADDDPFYTEVDAFIDVVEGKATQDAISSTYEDGVKTYELTWAIRLASEESRA
ncbi:hypothetical protein CVT24_013213 [Panaeolus cyanescens]|uniref:Gfo/Idh/MocA-like oxidoreductase N-terminal domain-containing protein n=1 Tax=Panaeolus cyanescens TaxID=181874 RepID=A0A409WDA5_9AGAR|nr:hypothetical protein CVT24_013213 [Panaeolus cyanescens]